MPVIPIKHNVGPAFGTFLPTRRATGEDFDTTGPASRALAQAGEKITQAASAFQEAAERDDALTAQKSIADIRTTQTLRIQKMQTDGGPNGEIGAITTTATQEADAALSVARAKLGTGKGKRMFDAMGADLKATLVPRAAAVQAHLVGLKAKAQFDDTLNALGTALVSDPTQLQSALKQAEIGIMNTPGLPAEARIQLAEHAKEVLTKAAVQGLITVNPWAAVAALKKGVYDATLKLEDKAPLINAAETQIRARRYDAEVGTAAAARAQRLKDMKLSSDALPKIVDGTMTAAEILKMDASYSAKVDLLSRMEHYQKAKGPAGESDPDAVRDLFRGVTAPPGATGRIETQEPLNQAVLDRKISLTMRNFLVNTLQARDNPAEQPYGAATLKFLNTVEPMFRTPYNLSGVNFSDRYAVFGQIVMQRVQEYAQQGKNVNELFDPQNKDSLFKMLDHYKPTVQEATRRLSEVARAAQQPQPGQPGQPAPGQSGRPTPGQPGQIPARLEKPAKDVGDFVKGRGADGVQRTYRFKGGSPTDPRNYEALKPLAPPGTDATPTLPPFREEDRPAGSTPRIPSVYGR